jgi:hypothetical protein
VCRCQGDQIGRIFGFLGDCFLWEFFLKIAEIAKKFCTPFDGKRCMLILTKNGLGYSLGDFFSQTHLVTLAVAKQTP